MAATIIAILAASLIGEMLYVSVWFYRKFGEFDLSLGFKLLVPFFQSYEPSWIFCKLLVAAAIGLGCYFAAENRALVGMPI